jgi:hypothetical protein
LSSAVGNGRTSSASALTRLSQDRKQDSDFRSNRLIAEPLGLTPASAGLGESELRLRWWLLLSLL